MEHMVINRPTLVLLCGLLCDEEIWQDAADSFHDLADVRILSFSDFSSIQEMASYVLKSVPHRFALAGHSMGGRVALEMMRQGSGRITGLALLNTGVHPPAPHEPERRSRLVRIARERGMAALAAVWLPPMLGRTRNADDPLMVRLTNMVQRYTPDSFAAQIRALLDRPDAEGLLRNVRVPLLLLSASGDRWSPPRQHEAMRDICRFAELFIVADAGHMAPIERPEVVALALRAWMNRIVPLDRAKMTLTDLDRMLITDACTRQILRYARLNDAGAHDAVGALFTDDGILARPSHPDKLIRGRTEILASFRSRPPRLTRHVASNVEVFVESAGYARASSNIVLYSSEGDESPPKIATIAVGSFDDVLRKVGDEWLFAERRGSMAMKSTS